MKKFIIIVAYLSGIGAEHITKDGTISKYNISFGFPTKKDAEIAKKKAINYFKKKKLKRKFSIYEVYASNK